MISSIIRDDPIRRLLVVSLIVVATSCTVPLQAHSSSGKLDVQSHFDHLPALFNFTLYRQHFAKSYGSQLEAVTRKVYYLANAFKVYVAGMAYRNRQLSYFLAVNYMSDWSPQERDMMINKRLTKAGHSSRPKSADVPPIDLQEADNPEVLANELERSIAQRLHEGHIELTSEEEQVDETSSRAKRARRQKRAAPKRNRRGPREFHPSMLVKDNRPRPESAKVLAKVAKRPISNNPLHDPLEASPWSRGLIDQLEPLEFWTLKKAIDRREGTEVVELGKSSSEDAELQEDAKLNLFGRLKNYLSDTMANVLFQADSIEYEGDNYEEEKLPDVMYQDLNESGCLFQPRRQLRCGSCYAFAAIALAEYLFCKQTGRLYAFSEQYMIDCGKYRIKGMFGCNGAIEDTSPLFVHNFGLELRDRYPYVARETRCPYSNDTDPKTTGYVRMRLRNFLEVPVRLWSEVLEHSPLIVSIATPPDFDLYGGGVDGGRRCVEEGDHAMLVVGEGREDGQDFWLIRNSYGPQWGEEGHWKLAKSAPKRCIEERRGFVWSSLNGAKYELEPMMNGANPNVIRDLAALKAVPAGGSRRSGHNKAIKRDRAGASKSKSPLAHAE